MREIAPAMDAVRGELVDILKAAKSRGGVQQKLKAWAKSPTAFDTIGDAIFVPAVMSDLAGQLMVYGPSGAKLIKLAAADSGGAMPPTGPSVPSPKVTAFLDEPWEQALADWRARGLMSDRDFETLLKGYAERSDVARKLMLEHLQETVMQKLDAAIANGGSQKAFAADVQSELESLGISRADPSYVDMVMRTNIQGAYGAGRYRAMLDPDVQDAMPYVQYRTVGDARVRLSHALLDGLVWDISGSQWHRVAPPNGFNCRCSQVLLSKDEAEQYEIVDSIPDGGAPEDGFDGPPVAKVKLSAVRWRRRVWSLSYNPSQERDDHGMWSSGGGSAAISAFKKTVHATPIEAAAASKLAVKASVEEFQADAKSIAKSLADGEKAAAKRVHDFFEEDLAFALREHPSFAEEEEAIADLRYDIKSHVRDELSGNEREIYDDIAKDEAREVKSMAREHREGIAESVSEHEAASRTPVDESEGEVDFHQDLHDAVHDQIDAFHANVERAKAAVTKSATEYGEFTGTAERESMAYARTLIDNAVGTHLDSR